MLHLKIFLFAVLLLHVLPAFTRQEQLISPINTLFKEDSSDNEDITSSQDKITKPPRMLASRRSDFGEIASSIMIEESSALLSNSEEVIFLSLFNGPLKVIDVSDITSPSELASLPLTKSYQRGMAVSPDDKTLYVTGVESLEIVNVSNPSNPELLGKIVIHENVSETRYDKIRPTISVSSDGKFAYVGLLSLEVYDVSDPKSIKQIYSTENSSCATTVRLLKDEKTLIFENENLHFYNVSTPSSPIPLSEFISDWEIADFVVSSDEKTLYITHENEPYPYLDDFKGSVEVLDISDINAPQRKSLFVYPLEKPDSPSIILSRNESHFYVLGDTVLKFLKLEENGTYSIQPATIHDPLSFCLSKNDLVAYVVTKGQFFVLHLLINLQLDEVFSINDNLIGQFPVKLYPGWLELSPDENLLYIASIQQNEIQSYDVSKYSAPKLISKGNTPTPRSLQVSKDGTLLYSTADNLFTILNASNLETLASIRASNTFAEQVAFTVSHNDIKVFVVEPLQVQILLTIYDISTPNQPKKISSNEIAIDPDIDFRFRISKDCKTAFFMSPLNNMSIVDISDPENPILLSSLFQGHFFTHLVFSPTNESITFMVHSYKLIDYLSIIDFSNLKAPNVISSFLLPYSKIQKKCLKVSSDSKTVFVSQTRGVTIIDVSILSDPVILTSIDDERVYSFTSSKDGKLLFLGDLYSQILVRDRVPSQTIFFPTKSFGLGGFYSCHLPILRRNNLHRYDPFPSEYKFAEVSLYMKKIIASKEFPETSYSPLPNWMHFDPTTGILTLEPKSFGHISSYNFHAVISTEIPDDVFLGKAGNKTKKESLDLIISLIGLGYLDNEGFLTSSFSPDKRLRLPSQENVYEPEIRSILEDYYFSLSTLFRVESSLSLSKRENGFALNTGFPSTVNVLIILSKNESSEKAEAQFLSLQFSGVLVTNTNQKTRLAMEGPLEDINNALEELTINLQENSSYCNGSITVGDGFNPKITQDIFNISSYFKANQAPRENKENLIQSQVDRVPILFGEYFQIDFVSDSFVDDNPEFLKFSLRMRDQSKTLPGWLTMKEFRVSGVPPEQITLSKIDLVMVASNEFKIIEVPFIIHIRIPFTLIMKLSFKYASYAISAIGLYIIVYKIYNILGTKFYRHPKKFILLTGKEIPSNSIYPISFIAEELNVSRYVQKKIREEVSKELEKKKLSDSEFVEYFINSEDSSFNRLKLDQYIHSVLQTFNLQQSRDLQQSSSRLPLFKKLIYDLIYYDMVNKHLNHLKERKTKQFFDSIKSEWVQFIEYTKDSQFGVKEDRLQEKLDLLTLEKRLKYKLLGEDFNLPLLKNALLGYVFQYHNLDLNIHDIDITVVEKLEKTTFLRKLKALMKTDHLSIPSNEKGKAGYGIKYRIKQKTLSFYGVPEEAFVGRTLVVQIMTTKKRIIRELRIIGYEGESPLLSAKGSLTEEV